MGWDKPPNFQERVEGMVLEDIRKMSLKVLRGVVTRTPVRTGRLRGNWQTGVDSVPTGEVETPDKGGSRTIHDGEIVFETIAMNTDSIWIVNNLPYAQPIEDGHGGRNPGVMVASTLAVLKLV